VPSNFLCYAVPHSLLENISLCFVLQQVFEVVTFLCYTCQQVQSLSFFFPLSYALFHTFISECDCTPLHCFYKGCVQSNQQLVLCQFLRNIQWGSTIFPYEALERRRAQKILIGCVGLHNIKNSKALNIRPLYRMV
jgi:hypothetical protein